MIDIFSLVPADFQGVVALGSRGGSDEIRAYGWRDLPNQMPNRPDTRFPTASAGKAFVAAGIMRLLAEGRMRLDSTLGELARFPLGDLNPTVTVRQLLNHTSGVPDYFDESVMEEYEELWVDLPNYRIRHASALLPLFVDKPPLNAPGERFQYNNSGYVLLGLLMENVTGLPFDRYLREAVFDPFGMADTAYWELDKLPGNCANAYIEMPEGGYRTNIFSVDVKGTGAGGAFTTAGDCHRFWRGLLSDERYALMFAPQTPGGEYGCGLWLDGPGRWHFEGQDPGVSCLSGYEEKSGRLLTVISNFGQDVWKLWWEMTGKLEETV